MTCIVGVESNGHVYLGGDAAGSDGWHIDTRIDEKVFKNEAFVMGYTTSFRMGQLLRYAFTPPDHPTKKDDMAYLVTDFVDSIRGLYKDKGFLSKSQDEDESHEQETGGTFLLGYRGKLYSIEDDFQICRTHGGYAACGSGHAYALGSLFTTEHIKDPIVRLQLALEVAAKYAVGVRGPFSFISTKSEDYVVPASPAQLAAYIGEGHKKPRR